VLADPMFDSLRAWSRGRLPERDIPIEWTLAAMDETGTGQAGAHGLQKTCN
jgi:hypothetical protein